MIKPRGKKLVACARKSFVLVTCAIVSSCHSTTRPARYYLGLCPGIATPLRDAAIARERDRRAQGGNDDFSSGAVPYPRFDWTDSAVVTPPRTQWTLSCWAFATSALVESATLRAVDYGRRSERAIHASEQQITSCSGAGTSSCGGWWALDFARDSGVVDHDAIQPSFQSVCIQHTYRIGDWGLVSLPDDSSPIQRIQRALLKHGPVGAGIYASPTLINYSTNDSTHVVEDVPSSRSRPINHLVVITGWDTVLHAWHIKNSWGPRWGYHGFAWIRWSTNRLGEDAVWVDARPSEIIGQR